MSSLIYLFNISPETAVCPSLTCWCLGPALVLRSPQPHGRVRLAGRVPRCRLVWTPKRHTQGLLGAQSWVEMGSGGWGRGKAGQGSNSWGESLKGGGSDGCRERDKTTVRQIAQSFRGPRFPGLWTSGFHHFVCFSFRKPTPNCVAFRGYPKPGSAPGQRQSQGSGVREWGAGRPGPTGMSPGGGGCLGAVGRWQRVK